jgi:hypothetical protein
MTNMIMLSDEPDEPIDAGSIPAGCTKFYLGEVL